MITSDSSLGLTRQSLFSPDTAASKRLDELATLLNIDTETQTVRRDQEIMRAGHGLPPLFLLIEGVAISYRILRNGEREILDVVLPGDFAGIPSCLFENTSYSVRTLTRVVILPIPVASLRALCNKYPKISVRIFGEFASKAAIYEERLSAVRRPATERVAHFLLELFNRMERVGLTDKYSFQLPLTQEMMGDTLGLSNTYISRVLHRLRQERLVYIKDHMVVIENMEELMDLADFDANYLTPLSLADFATKSD